MKMQDELKTEGQIEKAASIEKKTLQERLSQE